MALLKKWRNDIIDLHTIIEYLEPLLRRESVECKQYDYTAIQYTSDTVFSVTIDETQISENITQIIIYTNGECVGLLCTTPHLTKYNFNLSTIETIEVQC